MTDFRGWDKKAAALVKEAEEQEKVEKEEARKAVGGLAEGEVEGPPVANHKAEQSNMKQLSKEKEEMLQKLQKSEVMYDKYEDGVRVVFDADDKDAAMAGDGPAGMSSSSGASESDVVIDGEGKCIKIRDCKNTNFRILGKTLKVMLEHSTNVKVTAEVDVQTSSSEINKYLPPPPEM